MENLKSEVFVHVNCVAYGTKLLSFYQKKSSHLEDAMNAATLHGIDKNLWNPSLLYISMVLISSVFPGWLT